MRTLSRSSLALLPLLLACGPADTPDGDDSTPVDSGDTDDSGEADTDDSGDSGGEDTGTPATTPALVRSVPADGASGVDADTTVTLVFSEPMDAPSVEAALTSFDPAAGLAWNADDTELTLTPSGPLPYAEGRGVDLSIVDAEAFAVEIGTGARSAAGVALAEPVVVRFTTWRRLYASFGMEPRLTGHVYGDDFDNSDAYEPIRVGDLASDVGIRGFVTFDFSELPETAARVESATWYGSLVDTFGNADTIAEYTQAEHLVYASLDEEAFTASALTTLGAYSTWTDSSLAHDVTAAVQDDLDHRAERGHRTQFRIRFDRDTNDDGNMDYYAYDGADGQLAVTYLAP